MNTQKYPIIIAPGWSEDSQHMEIQAKELEAFGYHTLIISHPRTGKLPDKPFSKEKCIYPPAGFQRSLNIIGQLEDSGWNKVDVIAHSQGCIDATVAAILPPEKFNLLLFLNPAGLLENDSFVRLVARYSSQLLQDPDYHRYRSFKHVFKNPYRAYKEAKSVAGVDIRYSLLHLRQKHDIKVAIVTGTEDPVFPIHRLHHLAPEAADNALHVDYFTTVPGDHNDLHRKPKVYMQMAVNILNGMQNS